MKKVVKRELIEWVVILSVIGIIYVGGWHTEVIGRFQQAVLSTGIISPNLSEDEVHASYTFMLEDIDGNQISFSDFEEQVVFVNFWATWCPPCIAEMPDIHSLYEQKKDSVSFVMVSLDKDEKKARDFISRREFDFPVYFLRSGLPATYNIHSIPTTYVIDKNGIIRVENHGMAKYNTKKFKSLLADLSKLQ